MPFGLDEFEVNIQVQNVLTVSIKLITFVITWCPSSICPSYFNHLFKKHWRDFNQTWQKCYFAKSWQSVVTCASWWSNMAARDHKSFWQSEGKSGKLLGACRYFNVSFLATACPGIPLSFTKQTCLLNNPKIILETMYKMSFQSCVTFVSIGQPRCLPIWQEFVFNYGEMNKSFFLETANIIIISCTGMVIGWYLTKLYVERKFKMATITNLVFKIEPYG